MTPVISIITPCYNHGIYLDELIESLNLKGYSDVFEHIIINDGSTEAYTIQKLKQLEAGKSIVIHQENKGLAKARNAGIQIARGRYILPLDSDNKLIPEVFLEAAQMLDKDQSLDVVHTYAYYFGERSGLWVHPEFDLNKSFIENHIDACSLIRRRTLINTGGYSTDMPVMGHEDWELWIKIAVKGGCFKLYKKPGFYYRVSENSMVRTVSIPNASKTQDYIFSKYYAHILPAFLEVNHRYNVLSNLYNRDKSSPFRSFIKYLYHKYIS